MARVTPDDWCRRGQEKYSAGVTFRRTSRTTADPEWDHDHCAFCWRKLARAEVPDAVQDGCGTLDLYYWVCSDCFEDFREEFDWKVAESMLNSSRH